MENHYTTEVGIGFLYFVIIINDEDLNFPITSFYFVVHYESNYSDYYGNTSSYSLGDQICKKTKK